MALVRSFMRFPTIVEFGAGKRFETGRIAASLGKRAYLILDPFFKGGFAESDIENALRAEGVSFVKDYGVRPNPRSGDMDASAKKLKEAGCDIVIAMGGGSCIDIGKSVAMLATNGRSAWDYTTVENEQHFEVKKSPLPLIVLPTTSGTGSEGTIYSVVTSPELRRKCTIRSFYMYPSHAIIDPELMKGLPPLITALTGIDTFAHAYESYTNRNATLFSRMVAFEAMRLFAENIEECVNNGKKIEARAGMAFASLLGGVAISHCPTTIPHVIGQCLSGWVDAPHGGSLACCISAVIRWTPPEGESDLANVARLFDSSLNTVDDRSAARALPGIIDGLFARLLPERVTMRKYGMDESRADEFADFIYDNYRLDIANYIKQPDREDIRQLVKEAM